MQEALSVQDELRSEGVGMLRELEGLRDETAALREGHAGTVRAASDADSQAAQAQSEALQQVYLFDSYPAEGLQCQCCVAQAWHDAPLAILAHTGCSCQRIACTLPTTTSICSG